MMLRYLRISVLMWKRQRSIWSKLSASILTGSVRSGEVLVRRKLIDERCYAALNVQETLATTLLVYETVEYIMEIFLVEKRSTQQWIIIDDQRASTSRVRAWHSTCFRNSGDPMMKLVRDNSGGFRVVTFK